MYLVKDMKVFVRSGAGDHYAVSFKKTSRAHAPEQPELRIEDYRDILREPRGVPVLLSLGVPEVLEDG